MQAFSTRCRVRGVMTRIGAAFLSEHSDKLVRKLTMRQARVIAEALFATADGPPPASRMEWLGAELDDFLQHIGPDSRNTFRAFLLAVAMLAPVLMRRLGPLGAMSISERIEALERIDKSWASGALLAVKASLCVLYYEHPEVAEEIGFDGRCLKVEQ